VSEEQVGQLGFPLVGGMYIYEQQGGRNRTLWEMVCDYRNGYYVLPPHQREDRWSETKKVDYINRIRGDQFPPGSFETYQIVGDTTGQRYLNDGGHRMRALLNYVGYPGKWGDDSETAERILRGCMVSVTHHQYNSHEAGHVDFILVNMGTMATAYEQCRGFLCYIKGESEREAERVWVIWEHLHEQVGGIMRRVCGKANAASAHKYMRHDYALFYRWYTKDASRSDYGISKMKLTHSDIVKGQAIEIRLSEKVKSLTLDELRGKIDEFVRRLEHETATVQTVFTSLGLSPGRAVSAGCWRWLMDVALWRRNANWKRVEDWKQFLGDFLRQTEGGTAVFYEHADGRLDTRRYIALTMSDMGKLAGVCRILGSDFGDGGKSGKSCGKMGHLFPGYDESHVVPRGVGDEVLPENAADNRSRGRRAMTSEEYEALKEVSGEV